MPLTNLTRLVALASIFVSALSAEEAPKRVGIIGLDTSHVVAFTTVLNKGPKNAADAAKFSGFRVTAAFAQGSKDIPESTMRVQSGCILTSALMKSRPFISGMR